MKEMANGTVPQRCKYLYWLDTFETDIKNFFSSNCTHVPELLQEIPILYIIGHYIEIKFCLVYQKFSMILKMK